jgi:acyl carrier protein
LDDLRQRIMRLLEEWAERNDSPLPDFADTDDLFELGIVDSMLMVEIVSAVEEATGSVVDFLEVDPEIFYTIAGIMKYAKSAAGRETPPLGTYR